MYHKLLDKKDTSFFEFVDERIFGLTNVEGVLKLAEFDSSFNIKWFTQDSMVNNFVVYENNIIYTVYRTKTVSINFEDLSVNYETKEPITIFNNSLDNSFYYDYDKDNFLRFDMKKGEVIKMPSKEKLTGLMKVLGMYIIHYKSTRICIYNKTDFSLLWQKDLSKKMRYEHEGKVVQGEIKQVKQYKNSLIVVSDGGIIRLALDTGDILWNIKSYTRTMEIVDETGYCCSGLSLWKLNLESGENSDYGWEYNRLPDIEWQGRTYWPIGHEVIYHEGLLWYAVYASGHSFLVAINPHDGHYEWVHHVDTNEKIESPRFHNNNMFLLDTGGTLHIYKKENIEQNNLKK